MADTERALQLVDEILAASPRYPWKTARYLARKLRERDCRITPGELEDALLEHARSPGRRIRYSFFPARKTLDLLWGHVREVNDFDRLPDPALVEQAGEFQPCELPDEALWYFLSHSFRDLKAVRAIRELLLERGYGVWMAEAEVFLGDMIAYKVQEGLERSDQLLVYMTRRSLGSRWVLKEAGVAVNRWHLPPVVLVDAGDSALLDLFQRWVEDRWDAELPQTIDALLVDAAEEPAATMLHELLVGALGAVPRDQRLVAAFPGSDSPTRPGFRSLEELFPAV